MTLTTYGYPGSVNQIQFSQMMQFLGLHALDGLSVVPVTGDRTVRVTFNLAWAPGVLVEQTGTDTVQVPANPSGNPRRDRLILKHDWNAPGGGATTLTYKLGTPAPSPSLPDITTDPGVLYEQHLASVTINPGQGQFTSGNISLLGLGRSAPVIRIDDDSALPHTKFGAIVVGPQPGRVRISDGTSYTEVQPATVGWTTVNQPEQWNVGLIRYGIQGGTVTVRGQTARNAGVSSSTLLTMGTLPTSARPAYEVPFVADQQLENSARYFGGVIETDGRIRLFVKSGNPPLAAEAVWVRFSVSYPIF